MQPINQNKHAILQQNITTRKCIRVEGIMFISELALCFMPLCSPSPFLNQERKNTNQDKAAEYAFKCLDISHRVYKWRH